MPRKVKRGCSSSPKRSKRCYKKKLTVGSRKKKVLCCLKRRQSRKRMRGSGYGSGSGSGLGGSPIPTNKV